MLDRSSSGPRKLWGPVVFGCCSCSDQHCEAGDVSLTCSRWSSVHCFITLFIRLDLDLQLFCFCCPDYDPSSATRTPEKSNQAPPGLSGPDRTGCLKVTLKIEPNTAQKFFNIDASFPEITGVIKSVWHLLVCVCVCVCVCVFDLMQSSSNWCSEDDVGQQWAIRSSAVSLPVLIISAVNVSESLDPSVNVNQNLLNSPQRRINLRVVKLLVRSSSHFCSSGKIIKSRRANRFKTEYSAHRSVLISELVLKSTQRTRACAKNSQFSLCYN